VLSDELRALWREPRVPDPPGPGWRDWALLAVCCVTVTLEAAFRADVGWRPVVVPCTLGVAALTLWRRSHPFPALALALGSGILLTLATLVAGQREPVGLYSGLVALVLVYALTRWGSGRDVVLGTAVCAVALGLSAVTDALSLGQWIGGLVVLTFPGVLGATVRFRTTARRRELDQLRSREREQLARELHDTVAHHVSAMVIRAQAGRVVAATRPAAAEEALEGIEEDGARTLEAMRSMVAALRDGDTRAELAPQAGIADVERLARGLGAGPRIDVTLEGPLDDVPPGVDAAAYRIVQESVTNALRHAVDATEIVVRITGEPALVRVQVQDDGKVTAREHGPGGYPPGGRLPGGYGLAGLRERAALLGGVLSAGPGPGGGWSVEVELPREGAGSSVHPRPRR